MPRTEFAACSVLSPLTSVLSLLNTQQHIRLAPETFQIVKLALAFPEDVDDHITVVEQHPSAGMLTLRGVGELAKLGFDGFADIFGQGADLAVARPRADHKEIRNYGVRA